MKKSVLLLFSIILFVSCSNLNNKLEKSLSDIIGFKPTENEVIKEHNRQIILWKNVNLGKRDKIKNSVDKLFGSLPIKESELTQRYDENGNSIENQFSSLS